MAFTGKEGNPIQLKTARRWVKNYKDWNRDGGKAAKTSWFFGSGIINYVLSQNECKGIRIYIGMDDEGNLHPLLVGNDEAENNQLPSEDDGLRSQDLNDFIIANDSIPSPPHAPENPL